jgi:flagellar M-ring protein FliF
MVDGGAKGLPAAQVQRLQRLVENAVGFDAERGDQLTVENIAFDQPAVEPEPPPPGFADTAKDFASRYWMSALRGLGVVALASFALFGILRPMSRRVATLAAVPALPAGATTAARLPTVREMEGQIDAELDAASAGNRRLPVLTKRVAKLASEEPEQLARIVRGWMTEDER